MQIDFEETVDSIDEQPLRILAADLAISMADSKPTRSPSFTWRCMCIDIGDASQ